jgi:hypothetical protein
MSITKEENDWMRTLWFGTITKKDNPMYVKLKKKRLVYSQEKRFLPGTANPKFDNIKLSKDERIVFLTENGKMELRSYSLTEKENHGKNYNRS